MCSEELIVRSTPYPKAYHLLDCHVLWFRVWALGSGLGSMWHFLCVMYLGLWRGLHLRRRDSNYWGWGSEGGPRWTGQGRRRSTAQDKRVAQREDGERQCDNQLGERYPIVSICEIHCHSLSSGWTRRKMLENEQLPRRLRFGIRVRRRTDGFGLL